MKQIVTFLFLVISLSVFGQNTDLIVNYNDSRSVFDKLSSGKFLGTANGVLFMKNTQNQEFILDFQGSKTTLFIEPEPDEVYDVSYKRYQTATTSGKTSLEYTFYGSANALSIRLNNETFEIGGIDGACDMIINYLDYLYKAENQTEYLVLQARKEIRLKSKKGNILTLQPQSVLVFAIKRK